ncbi:MAG TPA: phage tail sheath subtilisin-like domain-containing protein [Burkholderiales bacterium]|nr:phage tail sheath subtilisin-like domain-containing protein [Burkholderiales bacterium]
MAEYLHPGVYVEEKSSGVKPIEGVGTSTAAFIGITSKGIPNKATFITNWSDFVRKFGYLTPGSYLPYAVQQFFSNGGKRCYIVRVLSDAAARAATVDLPSQETNAPARNTLRITAKGNGAWGNSLAVLIEDGSANSTLEFKIVVFSEGEVVELFDNLSMDPAADNYVESEVNDASDFIEVEDLHAATELLNGNPMQATATSTAALASPVVFGVNGVLTIEGPEGTTGTVDLATLVTPTPADVVAAVNTAFAPFNVTASLTTLADGGTVGRLRLRSNVAGYDSYFTLGGNSTGAGPLAGMAGFAQGRGAALGATLKSAVGLTFNTVGNTALNVSINAQALPAINLTSNATLGIDTVVNELNTAFTANANGLVRARREGDRVVIETVNRGSTDNDLEIDGGASGATVLNLRPLNRGAAYNAGDVVIGFGRSEPAFVQSAVGPFTIEEDATLDIVVNNGNLGANSAPITLNFVTGADFPNLQQVTATQVANRITALAAGAVTAAAEGNRVIIRQSNRGNYYRLQINDGLLSPNIRLQFSTQAESGFSDGDGASPYFRPDFNFVSGANEPRPLAGGTDGTPVSNFDLVGTADRKSGLHALDDIDDVNFIAIPGAIDPGVIGSAVGYCATRRDCFYIADAPGKVDKNTPITDPSKVQDFLRNKITVKESYGALYYPWLEIADPVGPGKNPKRFVPPSGFIAGLYARIDNTRGVWKAPAGTEASLFGAIGLEYAVTDSEQDILNPIGVNCLRMFADSGLVVWGARTLAAQKDPEYRYVPVRRYTIYLRQSIYRGTQWAVFEPNDAPLWAALKANIDDFLMGEFRKGALAGAKPEDAFDVKCDADLNPPSEVNAGRVNMEIRFAPLKVAEFVIIRISQKTQRPQA